VTGRADIIGRVRARVGLRRTEDDEARLAERLARHPRNLVPARAELDPEARRKLFVDMAVEAAASVDVVAGAEAVPEAVADYLMAHNLPARLVIAPDPRLDAFPWQETPLLGIRRGKAEPDDAVGLTPAFAAIAESGTLLLVSGRDNPTTVNFLPETHIVVLWRDQIVGAYEDAWDRLRATFDDAVPRTLNLITGPSRSADIEQTLQMGAHGPRRLHIIMIDADAEDG
jgi:L-lactate dehydrogenase complex protein LldG